MFKDEYIYKDNATYVGFNTPIYAYVYWLENGERTTRTICYSQQEVEDCIKNRTNYTFDKKFEIYRIPN